MGSLLKTYNPNAWCKEYCGHDLNYTSTDNPCKGTLNTCNFDRSKNQTFVDGRAVLGERSCWRFAFRFHMEECKANNGFMLQVEEIGGLGNGQKIETEMAQEVGIKIFRSSAADSDFVDWGGRMMKFVAKRIQAWYDSGCKNTDLENIYFQSED